MKRIGDIDIDVNDRDRILTKLCHVPASQNALQSTSLTKHNVGVYGQEIYADPFYGFSTLDYNQAEEAGYKKVDLLNLYFLTKLSSKQQLNEFLNEEPDWSMLTNPDTISQLNQISEQVGLMRTLKPASVEELAMAIAIIRPGKRHLLHKKWEEIRRTVWQPDNNGYTFKKSHATAYALNIVVQMNMLKHGIKVKDDHDDFQLNEL